MAAITDTQRLEWLIANHTTQSDLRYVGPKYYWTLVSSHGHDINPETLREEIDEQMKLSTEKHYSVWRGGQGGDWTSVAESCLSPDERNSLGLELSTGETA